MKRFKEFKFCFLHRKRVTVEFLNQSKKSMKTFKSDQITAVIRLLRLSSPGKAAQAAPAPPSADCPFFSALYFIGLFGTGAGSYFESCSNPGTKPSLQTVPLKFCLEETSSLQNQKRSVNVTN